MAGKNTAVFGIYPDRSSVDRGVEALKAAGFSNNDVSVLFPDKQGTKDIHFIPDLIQRINIMRIFSCKLKTILSFIISNFFGLKFNRSCSLPIIYRLFIRDIVVF